MRMTKKKIAMKKMESVIERKEKKRISFHLMVQKKKKEKMENEMERREKRRMMHFLDWKG